MENTMKLYRVTLKGMVYNSTGTAYGVSYVVAENSHEAYLKVKKFLTENNLGYSKEREMDKIELIAENTRYTNTGNMLYL